MIKLSIEIDDGGKTRWIEDSKIKSNTEINSMVTVLEQIKSKFLNDLTIYEVSFCNKKLDDDRSGQNDRLKKI